MGSPQIGSGLCQSFAEGRGRFGVGGLDRVEAAGGLGRVGWGAIGGVGWFRHRHGA